MQAQTDQAARVLQGQEAYQLTPPRAGAPHGSLRAGAAGRVAAGLAEGSAEVLVHHSTDVPLEIGEQDTSGIDDFGLRGALFLRAALFFFDAGRGSVAGEGAAGTAAACAGALRGFLHLRVKG